MMFLPLLDNSYFADPQPWKKAAFVGILACLLIMMGTYRSPAVALMPDLTPKPLRSKGNAVINLMGAIGGILYLIIASFLYSSRRIAGLEHVSYTLLFSVVACIMLLALAILLLTIRERKLAAEMHEHGDGEAEEKTAAGKRGRAKLPPAVRRSLLFLLSSIALWYFGYNAMETWFTTYANRVWNMAYGDATKCMTIATGGAILSYVPIGVLASRIGRKKTILTGTAVLSLCFFLCYLLTLLRASFSPLLYVLFALLGVILGRDQRESLPMVVEMCSDSEVGRFTGYYYTFSMAAQIVTPICRGASEEPGLQEPVPLRGALYGLQLLPRCCLSSTATAGSKRAAGWRPIMQATEFYCLFLI
jgi:MFS family permease